jgi:hypothetical protein
VKGEEGKTVILLIEDGVLVDHWEVFQDEATQEKSCLIILACYVTLIDGAVDVTFSSLISASIVLVPAVVAVKTEL